MELRARLRQVPWRRGAPLAAFLLCALVAAVVAAPVLAERAVERIRFHDELGTFPVEVGLCHDGRSTLDTGILGQVYWDRTGAFGFGVRARATGPPEAGGTLASYVDPTFINANVSFIRDPDVVVSTYSAEMRSAFWRHLTRELLAVAVIGGAALSLLVPWRRLREVRRGHVVVASVLLVDVAFGLALIAAGTMFARWDCNAEPAATYAVTDLDNPTFSSPQMREIVAQVQPFIDKNTRRIEAEAERYEADAAASFSSVLQGRAAGLVPRDGERIVLAEADPQGSFVGVAVRRSIYDALLAAVGEEAVALRTIAGDVTSNGTVAEADFVEAEATVAEGIPVVAVGGDHDSEKTWQQMRSAGFNVPDLDDAEVGGLRTVVANDSEHKTLFGGAVTNPTGVSERELGKRLREEVDGDDRPAVVTVHQPSALAGYLGLDTPGELTRLDAAAHRTTPYDDGIPDQPPGLVTVGHLHEADGPWVLWNTDGDAITWTVVDQLGTAGGVENAPTFSRFSTPISAPLKPIMVRLQYVDTDSGLQTGYATIQCGTDARCSVSERVDVGLPGGRPGARTGQPESRGAR